MGLVTPSKIDSLGLVSIFVLGASLYAGFFLHDERVEFEVDGREIVADAGNISSFGPRVSGSSGEGDASTMIAEMFVEAGLADVEVTEFEIPGSWIQQPEDGEEGIHMHAQIEQGAQNIPGFPDGTAGSGRVQLSSTGDLDHMSAFTFLGYSGGAHKHDSELADLGTGTAEEFSNAGDIFDKAILVKHDSQTTGRLLSDYYKDAIEAGASVLMIYEEGLETTYFEPVVVIRDDGQIVPFPVAYPELDLIPYIFITQSTADIFIEFIEEADSDSTKYAILDGNWAAAQTGPRVVSVVTGEIPGKSSSTVMIGSHHDTAYFSEGQPTESLGVAQIIEIARELGSHELEHTVRFASWGGEELGLLSSQAYTDQLEDKSEIELYINLDSAVLSESHGFNSITIEASSEQLAEKAKSSASRSLEGHSSYSALVIANEGPDSIVHGCSSHRSFNLIGSQSIGIGPQRDPPISSEIWPMCAHYREYQPPDFQAGGLDEAGAALVPHLVLNIVESYGAIGNDGPLIKLDGLEGSSENWVFPFTIALLAGLATGLGGLIVLFIREISRELMAFMLGMAAGVMLLISILDLLLGQASEFGYFPVTTSFVIGGLVILLIGKIVVKRGEEDLMTEENKLYFSGIFTAIALGIHNFPEGLAIGVAVLESAQYGVVLMIAIGLHNIPEGIAVAAPIKAGGGGKIKTILIPMATGLTEPLGALFALLILGSFLTPLMVGLSLAFVGGIMAVISFTEIIPQAINQDRSRYMLVGILFGAAVMQLSLVLLE